nr:PREDICTED: zinc finger protein 786 [Bos mutus]
MGTRGPATNRGSLWEVFFFLDPNQRVSPEGRRQGEGRRLQEGGNGRSARAKCWTGATGAKTANVAPKWKRFPSHVDGVKSKTYSAVVFTSRMTGVALPLTFEDVAIYFSEQEWQNLEAWQKELYKQVMRANYEILLSLDNGLPKPELISWIEQGRELFKKWGESQESRNIICSAADLHFDPLIEGQPFSGNQQAVSSEEAHYYFQVDPLQSHRSCKPLSEKSEDVSFRPDQAVALVNPQRPNTWALLPAVHSSREPTQRDKIASPRALGIPGFQKTASGEGLQQSCAFCGESFWNEDLLEWHQGSHSKAWKQLSKQPEAQQLRSQTHFRCPGCGRGFRRKPHLLSPLAVRAEESRPLGLESEETCGHRVTPPRPSPYPGCDEGASRGPPGMERPVSPREGAGAASEQDELPPSSNLAGQKCGRWAGGPEALKPGPGGERPSSYGACSRRPSQRCRPFCCAECGKSFRLKGILKAHERTHSRERPFQCAECGRGFTRPSKLAEHFRVHSGERPFSCVDCGRRFRLQGQLRSHRRLHTGERPFPCPDCGKSYRVKADLKAHQLLHGGPMPFSCECGKGFAKQSKLVEHVRTHTGEKPFQCPQCDKRFRLKAQLLSHQGLHTGERPFRCPECDKNFRERGHMLRHQRIHRPDRPFACADCGKGFIYKSKLAEHVRVHTKSCRVRREPDVKKRLSQLFEMIEADWS